MPKRKRSFPPNSAAGPSHAPKVPDKSLFFNLSPELRNMVYKYAILTGRTLIIRDMHPGEPRKGQLRSIYLALDHRCGLDPMRETLTTGKIRCPWSCPITDTLEGHRATSYTLGKAESVPAVTKAMLCVNKASREEVASLFYGENTFHFTSLSSLVPFMKDRTEATRKYIHHIQLTFKIDEHNWYHKVAAFRRSAAWDMILYQFLQLPHVDIRTLSIQVDDREKGMLLYHLKVLLQHRKYRWLHTLRELNNLEFLGVGYRWRGRGEFRTSPNSYTAGLEAAVSRNAEESLWTFLAPRMLKKEGDDDDDHSPDALQKRRIWAPIPDGSNIGFFDCRRRGNSVC